jgi:short-subunit dehydrogenase
MSDKLYVITGASDGLGKQLALSLIKDGHCVICLSRSKPDYEGVEWIQTDLTDRKSLDDASAKLNSDKRKIAALINNAGVIRLEDFAKLSKQKLEHIIKLNVQAPIELASNMLDKLSLDGGDVVNVDSTAGHKGSGNSVSYTASKWAVRGFSESLRSLFSTRTNRVINFSPGGMDTELFSKDSGEDPDGIENWMNPKDVAEFLKQILYLPKNMEVSEVIINRKKEA